MILEVLANTREIVHGIDANSRQRFTVPDTRDHQQLRRVDCSARQNHLEQVDGCRVGRVSISLLPITHIHTAAILPESRGRHTSFRARCTTVGSPLPACVSTPTARPSSNRILVVCWPVWSVRFGRSRAGHRYAVAALQRYPSAIVASISPSPSFWYPLISDVSEYLHAPITQLPFVQWHSHNQ
jgi:hypothetical protein